MSLEKELSVMVDIRERSVGIDLKRVNYKIAKLQNAIAVRDRGAPVADSAILELICGSGHLSLEAHLDEEFGLMRMKPYVYHIQPINEYSEGLPRAVTIASIDPVNVETMRNVLSGIEWAYRKIRHPRSQSVASFMKQQLEADGCAGIAVCDYRDQFSRKRGRIIAKGRLLRYLRRCGRRD